MEEEINRASEPQLRDFNKAGVITSARIVRGEGGYVLIVRVSWRLGESVIYSQRNKPRAWVSLDRLIAHLADVAPSIKTLHLTLDGVVPTPNSK